MDTENGSSLSQATMEDNDRFVFAVPSPVYTWYRGGELLTPERRSELGVSLVSCDNVMMQRLTSDADI